MRAEIGHHLLLASAKHQTVSQGSETGSDFDWPSSGIIEYAIVEGPTVNVPDPAGEGTIDDGGPEPQEDHQGDDATTFSDGASGDGGSHGTELHLSHIWSACVTYECCASEVDSPGRRRTEVLESRGLPGLGAAKVYMRPKCLRSPMKPLVACAENARE